MSSTSPPVVLVFSASDPTSGAGLQADLLTLASLACHPLTVVTALTVQDTLGVDRVEPVADDFFGEQTQKLMDDLPVVAIKVGLLGRAEQARVIVRTAEQRPQAPLVIDPVLASGRGDPLANEALVAVYRTLLLPRATLLTPNLPEAQRLAGLDARAGRHDCARRLWQQHACRQLLITGTHDDSPAVVNTLYVAGEPVEEKAWPRLPGSYHGSGCTLASACAAFLARGLPLAEAVAVAQRYTWQTLAAAYVPGHGQAIPQRLFGLPAWP